jgi:hypothetical protein
MRAQHQESSQCCGSHALGRTQDRISADTIGSQWKFLWKKWNRGSSVNIVSRLRTWMTGVRFPVGAGIFFLLATAMSRLALGPTQPPI